LGKAVWAVVCGVVHPVTGIYSIIRHEEHFHGLPGRSFEEAVEVVATGMG
jgi:hypothetical protein